MSNKRANKGITLIALIVTIIIMLILATVTIRIVFNGGLIKYAKKAKVDMQNAIDKEQEKLDGRIEEGGVWYNSIEDYIAGIPSKDQGEGINPGNPDPEEPDDEPLTYETAEKDVDGFLKDKAPFVDGDKTAIIPEGFKVIDGVNGENDRSIDGGLVVQAKDGSEFVWIPIDNVNDMFMCQAKTKDTICDIQLGEDGEPYCAVHLESNEELAKKMAGRLYATDIGNNFNASLTTQVYNANSGLREPAIVTNYDGNSTNLTTLKTIILGAESTDTLYDNSTNFLATLQTEYNEIVKSVIKNKGFYVGRYETSGMENSDVAAVPRSKSGVKPSVSINWYRMYAQQKKYVNETLDCIGGMIQGAAYDQVLKFVNTSTYNVTTAGNVAHNFSSVYETGTQSTDQSKNIFDLEGNSEEFTTEAVTKASRVPHGGKYYYGNPECFRDYYCDPVKSGDHQGSRTALYVK